MKRVSITLYLLLVICFMSYSQESQNFLTLGDEAPHFTGKSTKGTINFPNDFEDKWKLVVSHPQDFTPVCSSELLELANMQDDLKDLNTEIIVVSTDSLLQHYLWIEAMEQISYKNRTPVSIDFPLIDDSERIISRKYGMIHNKVSNTKNVRGVFIIDPENTIRSIQYLPMEIGRNIDDIVRTIVALQTYDSKEVLIPANWKPGDDVMIRWYNKELLAHPDVYQVAWFMTFISL